MKSILLGAALLVSAVSAISAQATPMCQEGEQIVWSDINADGHTERTLLTCKNGSFWSKPAAIRSYSKCKDGEVAFFEEYNGSDSPTRVARVCKNGRFYPKVKPVEPMKCKDGQSALIETNDGDDHTRREWIICEGGRWKKAN